METIGFVGLGVMGHSMAGHLLRSFGKVQVWNRTASKADDLVKEGATLAASPAALAAECTCICLCVSDTPDVEKVVFGENGIAESIKPGAVIIDFSTISAKATLDFAERIKAHGATWIDAPISGGDVGARNATLTIMAGASEEDFARAMPVFEALGKKIVHMGPVGSGQKTKMANQIACCGTIASMAEAMIFARESGMDVAKVVDTIGAGAAGSWSLTNYGPRVLKGDFAPGFSVELMLKDLRLVAEALAELEGDYAVFEHMSDVFARMKENKRQHLGVHGSAIEKGWSSEG